MPIFTARTDEQIRDFIRRNHDVDGNGCWIWRGKKNWGGYGRIHRGGYQQHAHQISYMVFNGPIPDGIYVCHKCDVRACVNPEHLFLGTPKDNMQDAANKDRMPRGERSKRSKLKDCEVLQIIDFVHCGRFTSNQIAKMYGVSGATIWGITRGITRYRDTGASVENPIVQIIGAACIRCGRNKKSIAAPGIKDYCSSCYGNLRRKEKRLQTGKIPRKYTYRKRVNLSSF